MNSKYLRDVIRDIIDLLLADFMRPNNISITSAQNCCGSCHY